jgi:predicted house-cleaning NTP pyrophosphatase (Maf/HAM1 superfamily)
MSSVLDLQSNRKFKVLTGVNLVNNSEGFAVLRLKRMGFHLFDENEIFGFDLWVCSEVVQFLGLQ